VTLIIGITCSDGIVIAADGAATLGAMGQRTVRQSVKKLTIIDGQVVVGVSGPVGLGQRITGVIGEMWGGKAFSMRDAKGNPVGPMKPHNAMTHVRQNIWKHIEIEMQVASAAGSALGSLAVTSAVSASILAMPLGHELCLFQFDQQGAPEQATKDIPFVAIGSGQLAADPFLGFVNRVLWRNKQPSLADGTFAAYWALDYVIQGDAGGVAEPKQLITISRQGSGWRATELEPEHLEEHQQSVEAAEQSLRDYKGTLSLKPGAAIAPAPPPPPTPAKT